MKPQQLCALDPQKQSKEKKLVNTKIVGQPSYNIKSTTALNH